MVKKEICLYPHCFVTQLKIDSGRCFSRSSLHNWILTSVTWNILWVNIVSVCISIYLCLVFCQRWCWFLFVLEGLAWISLVGITSFSWICTGETKWHARNQKSSCIHTMSFVWIIVVNILFMILFLNYLYLLLLLFIWPSAELHLWWSGWVFNFWPTWSLTGTQPWRTRRVTESTELDKLKMSLSTGTESAGHSMCVANAIIYDHIIRHRCKRIMLRKIPAKASYEVTQSKFKLNTAKVAKNGEQVQSSCHVGERNKQRFT